MPEGKCYASDTSITSPVEIRLHKLTPQVMICTHSLPASHNRALISLGKSTKVKVSPPRHSLWNCSICWCFPCFFFLQYQQECIWKEEKENYGARTIEPQMPPKKKKKKKKRRAAYRNKYYRKNEMCSMIVMLSSLIISGECIAVHEMKT